MPHKRVTAEDYEEALKLIHKATLLIAPSKTSEQEFKQLLKYSRLGGHSAETTLRRLVLTLNQKLISGVWF